MLIAGFSVAVGLALASCVGAVPVSTRLDSESGVVPLGGELTLRCDVGGYPQPEVYWTKDRVPITPSDRIIVTESRLTVSRTTAQDSGEYTCFARNAYSSHSSAVRITVRGQNIPQECTDSPFFADCSLIVKNKFCHHKYYSKFCCRSCAQAGLLNPEELNLQPEPWMKA